ncbi:MAG TPA: CinA family protein [Stellaceae bacterium]
MLDSEILVLANAVIEAYRARGWRLATAESCTGGLAAAALTEIADSSDVVERGYVTYSNAAKIELLGVPEPTILTHGAVSPETAQAMAAGAARRAGVDVAVSVTGIAGPHGGTAEKPVGLVHIGIARRGQGGRSERHIFPGDRTAVRRSAVIRTLEMLREEAA